MVWTPEPSYEKPDISVRATRLYYQIVAPIMLPFIEGRLLNLFRCREGKCFFQRIREHPPTGKEQRQSCRIRREPARTCRSPYQSSWTSSRTLTEASAFTIADVKQLLKRASALNSWGAGAQHLPKLR